MKIIIFSPYILFRVISKSFLCYGIGEAQQRYNFFLLNDNKTKDEKVAPTESSTDPCLAEGLTRQVFLEQLRGPCTLTDDSRPLLSQTSKMNQSKLKRIFKNYRKQKEKDITVNEMYSEKEENATKSQESESGSSITVRGSSNAAKCEEKMRQLFDGPLCESTFTFGDCMDARSLPLVNGTLYVSIRFFLCCIVI